MAYNSKAKVKVLYLLKILQEETDAEHGLSMSQLIARLGAYGVGAERKSVYADINALREFGVDVRTYQRNPVEYAIERRDFTMGELMLMVDAIQSCRAITERQARMLVANVKTLASAREQARLDRRIHVVGRIKSKNDSVFGNVDAVHDAIRLRCKVEFAYGRVGPDGKRRSTRGGRKHAVTPVGVSYDDGFYYLTAWDEAHGNMAEYRLDRMTEVRVLADAPATRNEEIAGYRFEGCTAAKFGRFAGEEVTATLSVPADKAEIVIDRFGDAATFVAGGGDGEAHACVRVCKSEQFFGWVAGMGKVVRIVAPESLVGEYRNYLRYLLDDAPGSATGQGLGAK